MKFKNYLLSIKDDIPTLLFLVWLPEAAYQVSKLITTASKLPAKDFKLIMNSFGFVVSITIVIVIMSLKKLNKNTTVTAIIIGGLLILGFLVDIIQNLNIFENVGKNFILACLYTSALICTTAARYQRK